MKCALLHSQQPDGAVGLPDANTRGQVEMLGSAASPQGRDGTSHAGTGHPQNGSPGPAPHTRAALNSRETKGNQQPQALLEPFMLNASLGLNLQSLPRSLPSETVALARPQRRMEVCHVTSPGERLQEKAQVVFLFVEDTVRSVDQAVSAFSPSPAT